MKDYVADSVRDSSLPQSSASRNIVHSNFKYKQKQSVSPTPRNMNRAMTQQGIIKKKSGVEFKIPNNLPSPINGKIDKIQISVQQVETKSVSFSSTMKQNKQ